MNLFTQITTALLFVGLLLISSDLLAQFERGTPTSRRVGVHDGNEVRTVFTNYGVIGQPGSQGPNTAWKYNANGYATDIQPIVGVQLPIRDYRVNGVRDGDPDTLHSVIGCNASRSGIPDLDPGGSTFWGFEPIPGFFNPALDEQGKGVAMSHLPQTWPDRWPDHPNWVDENGDAEWNGYFGRGVQNADQESYFLMDDQRDKKMSVLHGFYPDSTDSTRQGQALRVSVRGLQWSNFLAKDVLFVLYEITNVGTEVYDKAAFGTLVGTYVGVGPSGGDEWMDDASFFNIRESITYTWDYDHYIRPSANPQWKPNPSAVGYIGYAFLESPGNSYDGIDNDGDGKNGTGLLFTEDTFQPYTVGPGDELVLIDKSTYERTLFTMPDTAVTVVSMDRDHRLVPGETLLKEGNMFGNSLNPNAYDGIDNDLDGLIDENYQLHYRQYKESEEGVVLIDTLNPVKHVDFVNGIGLDNPLIDEARNDGIDNDGDWDPEFDDVGADGKRNSGDTGEGDGQPTEGEPNFDSKDVDESDQIGLTGFDYFVPSTDIDMSDEENMWKRMAPGRFDVPESVVNNRATRGEDGDFIFSSGYFPLLPGQTERFSMALVFGEDYEAVVRSKNIAQIIYDANYNFPRPPEKPTLTAVPGDGKVTLYWDKIAESSFDMALKEQDFEGYKIYKSTDPNFTDIKTISNGYGELVDYQPVAQYDLKNGIRGFFNADPILTELSGDKPFYLGEDSGLKNTFVDEDVVNGRTYYYAVCAYDRGSQSESIYPSENSKSISVDVNGNVTTDKNTAEVTPGAQVSGYTPPKSSESMVRLAGKSSAIPVVEAIDPIKVENTSYYVTFTDSLVENVPIAYAYSVVDSGTGDTLLNRNEHLWEDNGEVFDGLRISFDTHYQSLENIKLDTTVTGWFNGDSTYLDYVISEFEYQDIKSTRFPRDYMFVFSDDFDKTSSRLTKIFGSNSPLQQKTTNFEVLDVTDPDSVKAIEYGFVDRPGETEDTLSHFDAVYLSNDNGELLSWRVVFRGQEAHRPLAGDTLLLSFHKPFSSGDKFVYRSVGANNDKSLIKQNLDKIKAVPNPYVVTNVFEKPLPTQLRGRGERVVNFINLPQNSKVHIYASNGDHIRTLRHEGNIHNGSVTWDLRSKEGLDVAFGVYLYVVEIEGMGNAKVGKLALIK